MAIQTEYQYLETRSGSNYGQFFIKGRKIRAEILYRATVNSEPRSPEEVALDFEVPLEAVLEAIHFSKNNQELLNQERERSWQKLQANHNLGGNSATKVITSE